MSTWFSDLWEMNEEFFNQPAFNSATPYSQLDKLAEELEELREDHSVEEAADVLVCLIGFLIKSNISCWEFLEALDDKTSVNLARTWKLQPNGTHQHVKVDPVPFKQKIEQPFDSPVPEGQFKFYREHDGYQG